jgi:hypothetical protein
MGDRALIVMHSPTKNRISPVCSLHWGGKTVGDLLEKTCARMTGRAGDPSYSFARLVGIAHEGIEGNLSLGVWCLKNQDYEAALNEIHSDDFTHLDAGVFIVNVDDSEWVVECWGGYGLGKGEGTYRINAGKKARKEKT